MTDAATILAANGLGLADELVRAAQLEGVELAVAAAVIEGETRGRNIWGHDTNVTAGTYTPGGPVTRENYLAYRAAMRAGKIKRNGVGPAQCTSAQYQDDADALGGCWDPVANMRSGFRGIGALIKRYGVQLGAQHYNGSGPNAVAYGKAFLTRYQRWAGLLKNATSSTPPASSGPRPVGTSLVQNIELTGRGSKKIGFDPPGARVIGEAYLSAIVDGPAGTTATATCYPQHPGGGTMSVQTLSPVVNPDNTSSRPWFRIADGTDQINVQFQVPDGATLILIPAFRAQV